MKLVQHLFLLALMFLISCTPKINQYKNGKQHGKWIMVDSQGDSSVERYRNGIEHGLSKQFSGGDLYRTERIYGRRSKIKFYHTNGKISSRGWVANDDDPKIIHWYYTGTWKYFNELGKLIEVRIYKKGHPISEKMIY